MEMPDIILEEQMELSRLSQEDRDALAEITDCPWCGSDRIDFDHDDNLKRQNKKSCDVCNMVFTVSDGSIKILK